MLRTSTAAEKYFHFPNPCHGYDGGGRGVQNMISRQWIMIIIKVRKTFKFVTEDIVLEANYNHHIPIIIASLSL